MEGFPGLREAGNVVRTHSAVKISVRLPPTKDPKEVEAGFKKLIEDNPPYNATVSFEVEKGLKGWSAPALADWLRSAVNEGSSQFFDQPMREWGEGGSIPFMGMLGEKFPQTQFVITGVLGPGASAHAPNEFLHIDTAKRLTGAVATVLARHYTQFHQ